MFKFKSTKKTYSDPIAATFKPGIPFGRKYSAGDICLIHDGFQGSKTFLNSKILREALLNSKEFLEEVLEISIEDKRNYEKEPKESMEVIEADLAKGNVPESGKELILDSEDLIVGNADSEASEKVTEEVVIEGVNEIPEGAEIVDEVVIDAPENVDITIVDSETKEVIETIEEKKTKKTSKK